MTLGNQLMASGRVDEAKASFEKAGAANDPQLPMAQWRLAKIVLCEHCPGFGVTPTLHKAT